VRFAHPIVDGLAVLVLGSQGMREYGKEPAAGHAAIIIHVPSRLRRTDVTGIANGYGPSRRALVEITCKTSSARSYSSGQRRLTCMRVADVTKKDRPAVRAGILRAMIRTWLR
jgi:hypothetical protein